MNGSVRLSVCPFMAAEIKFSEDVRHNFFPIIVSSRNFQELLPMTKVTSLQKVKVRGQRSRSQVKKLSNLTQIGRFRTVTPV